MKELGLLVLFLASKTLLASDLGREKDFALMMEREISHGKIIRLQALQQPFAAVYTETLEADSLGTAIILHDRDGYPNRQVVTYVLRTTLPEHRWASLALQMPLREMGVDDREYYPLFDDARARVKAAIEFLRNSQAENIVLIGNGMGALMALYSIVDNQKQIKGLVTIGLPLPDSDAPQVQVEAFIKQLTIPVLDIYAEHDLPQVVNSARQRKAAGKLNSAYRQVKMRGSDHRYWYQGDLLAKRIYSWLRGPLQQYP